MQRHIYQNVTLARSWGKCVIHLPLTLNIWVLIAVQDLRATEIAFVTVSNGANALLRQTVRLADIPGQSFGMEYWSLNHKFPKAPSSNIHVKLKVAIATLPP